MRSRLIAIFILVFLVCIPAWVYVYLYRMSVSSVVFLAENNTPYTMHLSGKMEYTYFPLLDKIIEYKSTCQGSCIFSPIPPVHYTFTIESPGRDMISWSMKLNVWEQYTYNVHLTHVLELVEWWHYTPEYSSQNEAWYTIGTAIDGKTYITQGREVWRENDTEFQKIFLLPSEPKQASLDTTGNFFLFDLGNGQSSIFSLDGKKNIVFSEEGKVLSVQAEWDSWIVATQSWLYEFVSDSWRKNPRFTQYVDLSEKYRLGYIDEKDQQKLQLSNFPTNQSLLILLDRSTGKSEVVRKWISLQGFFTKNEKKYLLDTWRKYYEIEIKE